MWRSLLHTLASTGFTNLTTVTLAFKGDTKLIPMPKGNVAQTLTMWASSKLHLLILELIKSCL